MADTSYCSTWMRSRTVCSWSRRSCYLISRASPQLRTYRQRRCRTVSMSQRKRTRLDTPRSSIITVATLKSDLLVELRMLYGDLVCHCQTRKYSDPPKPRDIHGVRRSEYSRRPTFHVMANPAEVAGIAAKLLRNNCAAVAARARPYDASGQGLDSSGAKVS